MVVHRAYIPLLGWFNKHFLCFWGNCIEIKQRKLPVDDVTVTARFVFSCAASCFFYRAFVQRPRCRRWWRSVWARYSTVFTLFFQWRVRTLAGLLVWTSVVKFCNVRHRPRKVIPFAMVVVVFEKASNTRQVFTSCIIALCGTPAPWREPLDVSLLFVWKWIPNYWKCGHTRTCQWKCERDAYLLAAQHYKSTSAWPYVQKN